MGLRFGNMGSNYINITNEDWDDIIDKYDSETLTEGYEIVDIW